MSEGRSRRAPNPKVTKQQAAIERLKQSRVGGKNTYEVNEEEDVYDLVDEDEYAQYVSKLQREDIVVDDGTGAYVDHGRQVFDDEYDDEEGEDNSNGDSSRKKYSLKAKMANSLKAMHSVEKPKKGSDIRSMFRAQPITTPLGKKTLNQVTIDEKEIDSLVETITLNKTPTVSASNSSSAFTPMRLQKRSTPVSAKRKLPTPLSASTSVRNPFGGGGPLKKRVLDREEFNFDEIVDQIEHLPSLLDKKTGKEPQVSLVIDHNEPIDEYEDFDTAIDIDDEDLARMEIEAKTDKDESRKECYDWKPTTLVDPSDNLNTASGLIAYNVPEYDSLGDVDSKKTLRMFWFDAFLDPNHLTDTVYLFGKAMVDGKWITCSVAVTNLERRVYLLPREKFLDDRFRKVTMEDVLAEFSCKAEKRLKLPHLRSRAVTKRYAFELDFVPDEAEYLEARYPAIAPPLTSDLLSGNTYRYAFGANTSILENLILDCKLKGPCWLEILAPTRHEPASTWCKLELVIDSPNKIRVLEEAEGKVLPPSPNFTLLSLVVKNYVDPESKTNEVVAISCLVNQTYNFDRQPVEGKRYEQHFCLVGEPSSKVVNIPVDFTPKMGLKDYNKTTIIRTNNERELLNLFLAKFSQIDADIIVGHDIYDHDYDLLLDRYGHYKNAGLWSKLGRMKRSVQPRRRDKTLLAGRLVCDIRRLAQELIKATSYDLTSLAAQVLRKNRFEIGHDMLPNFYKSSTQLIRMSEFAMKDNEMILDIVYKINCLPLVRQISNVVGNLISRTMIYGRAERNEYLLLHAFHEKGYIVPDKADRYANVKKSTTSAAANIALEEEAEEEEETEEGDDGDKTKKTKKKKKKPVKSETTASYVGGLVLEPKVGYYNRFILLMDFNSLYPSIIQEYNICFTTIRAGDAEHVDELAARLSSVNSSGDTSKPSGILPTQIRRLVESRREVKRTLLDQSLTPDKRMQLDIKQLALKITANSMYGCLGFSQSRFYAKHLAAIVTYKGRDILMQTKNLVERLGFEVIYGDTDSIMILTTATKYDEVYETGRRIQKEVNRLYNLLEIDVDGVFRSMLLLKKKKYAALTMVRATDGQMIPKQEIKGLDIVRRDWSIISKEAGTEIVDVILNEPEQSVNVKVDRIHKYLQHLAERIRGGSESLEKFVITKSLTKRPEDYSDAKGLTHVMIAKRFNQAGLGKPLRVGDTVPYIICKDGSQNAPTQRGYHIEEIRKSPDTLIVDTDYYLAHQLLPVISRLCDPIEGTDAGTIAEFLGVQWNRRTVPSSQSSGDDIDPALTSGEHRFDCCQAFMARCPYQDCGRYIEIRDMFARFNLKTTDQKKKAIVEMIEKNKNGEMETIDEYWQFTLDECIHCHRTFEPLITEGWFTLQLVRNLKYHLGKYYRQVVECDDYTCDYRTRYLTGDHNSGKLECPKCQGHLLPTSSDHQLYQQINFFVDLFDFDDKMGRFVTLTLNEQQKKIRNEFRAKVKAIGFYERMQKTAQRYLDRSAYNEIDLGQLFRAFRY